MKQTSARLGVDSRFRGLPKIMAFAVVMIFLSYGLQLAIDHGLRSIRTSKFGAFNAVMSGTASSQIIVSGSSRALSHYDPAILQSITGLSTFNIGMNASQIDFQLAILKTFLRHNAKPAIVVQNLDSFSFETTVSGDIYDSGLYIPFLYDNGLYDTLLHIDPVVWKWRHIPLYGYAVDDMRFTWAFGLLGNLGYVGREDYFRGYNPRNASWNEDFDKFRNDHHSGVSYHIQPAGVQCLVDIIKLCQQSQIAIILVYSPEFAEMQALESNRGRIFQQFESIARSFNIPFLDYSSSPICRRRDLFQNSQHLNTDGAEVFTLDLARRLVGEHIIKGNLAKGGTRSP